MLWVSSLRGPIADPADTSSLQRDGGTDLLLVLGCRAWSNTRHTSTPCPVCKGSARRFTGRAVCLWCHEVSLLQAAILKVLYRKQLRNAEASQIGDAERQAKEDLGRKHHVALTERERRHLWMGVGYRTAKDFNIRVAAAREWLAEIDQKPDWTLIIDKTGRVIGRTEPPRCDA